MEAKRRAGSSVFQAFPLFAKYSRIDDVRRAYLSGNRLVTLLRFGVRQSNSGQSNARYFRPMTHLIFALLIHCVEDNVTSDSV